MKKLFCLLVIGFSCFLGCAPSETGNPAPSDNTSQIDVPAAELYEIENA